MFINIHIYQVRCGHKKTQEVWEKRYRNPTPMTIYAKCIQTYVETSIPSSSLMWTVELARLNNRSDFESMGSN